MTGLDHKNSELFIREKFAVSKDTAKKVMSAFMELKYIEGCVIISTCNRTEVYVSIHEQTPFNITEFLCRTIGLDAQQYRANFTERDEKETFLHLSSVGAGIDSQILGDDQIITQVREALELSREYGFTDSYIETMFRTAIKAAKEIKTKMIVRSASLASAPHKAVEKIKSLGFLDGKRAVVIGNGQMGKLASQLLLKESAHVTVTLREYKKGNIVIPLGADSISYGKRYEVIESADIVISATTSPHYTLHYDDFVNLNSKQKIIVDLSVPRDVEPLIGELPGINLFTIDDLGDKGNSLPSEKIELANQIIEQNMQNYYKWCEYKESIK